MTSTFSFCRYECIVAQGSALPLGFIYTRVSVESMSSLWRVNLLEGVLCNLPWLSPATHRATTVLDVKVLRVT